MKTLIDASLDERQEHQDNETEHEHDEHFVGQGIQRMKSLIHDHRILDRDGSDDMTDEEFTAMLSDMAAEIDEGQLDNDEIQALFEEIDSNGNDTIDVDEFVAWSVDGDEEFHTVDGNGNVININIYY